RRSRRADHRARPSRRIMAAPQPPAGRDRRESPLRRGPPGAGDDLMLLLCLDTATPQVGVGIGSDDQVIGRVQLARPQHHAEHLAPAIAYLLEQLDLSLDQLSAIGVGIGPGLFTGLRVGVTTAKVMAQALRIPLIAVPSLELLAFDARYSDRRVVPHLDAKRGEVFHPTYPPLRGRGLRV